MGADYIPAGYCPHCGYRIDPGRCPECGREVDRPVKRAPRRGRRLKRWLIGLSAFALALIGLWFGGRYIVYNWWPATHLRRLSGGSEPWRSWAYNVILYRYHKYEPLVTARADRIKAELKELPDHDWAGYYTYERAHVSPVYLAPNSGAAHYGGGLGPVRLNYGRVVDVSADALTLKLRFNPAGMGRNQVTEHMIRVWWGDCHFLIPGQRMISFCNAVNIGEEKIHYLSRDGCGEVRPPGFPEAPQEYEACIFREPLLTVVTAVDETRTRTTSDGRDMTITTARINSGARDRVFVGMELLRIGDPVRSSKRWKIRVVVVHETTATVEATWKRPWFSLLSAPRALIEAGSCLRTGGFTVPLTAHDTVPGPDGSDQLSIGDGPD